MNSSPSLLLVFFRLWVRDQTLSFTLRCTFGMLYSRHCRGKKKNLFNQELMVLP